MKQLVKPMNNHQITNMTEFEAKWLSENCDDSAKPYMSVGRDGVYQDKPDSIDIVILNGKYTVKDW